MSELRNCPTCESPGRHLHPAMQHEGEVQLCGDPWHTPPPDAQAMTREQVEYVCQHAVIDGHYSTRVSAAHTIKGHDAAQRETIRRLEEKLSSSRQVVDRAVYDYCVMKEKKDDLQASLTASEATIVRVYKLEKEIRDATHEMNYLSSMGMEFIEQSVKWYQSRLSPSPVPRWTTARPMVAGYYWAQWPDDPGLGAEILEITQPHGPDTDYLEVNDTPMDEYIAEYPSVEWQGPLTPGEE